MQKFRRMHRQTGERFVNPTATSRQMREVSDFKSLQPLTTQYLQTHLALTNYPEHGHSAAQMGNTTTRLIKCALIAYSPNHPIGVLLFNEKGLGSRILRILNNFI